VRCIVVEILQKSLRVSKSGIFFLDHLAQVANDLVGDGCHVFVELLFNAILHFKLLRYPLFLVVLNWGLQVKNA